MKHLLFLLVPLTLIACQRDREVPVRYKVDCGTCLVRYTTPEGNTAQRTVKMSWDDRFSFPAGATIALEACPLDTGLTVTPDNEWASLTLFAFAAGSNFAFGQASSLYPDSCASFSATVPER